MESAIICSNCTGCGACAYICPKSAIEFRFNDNKEYTAVIREGNCVRCGLCRKHCPQLNMPDKFYPQVTYAAWTKDNEIYNSTSSGGIASLLSKSIIENGGVVYGAHMNGKGIVQHVRIDRLQDINGLKGSKYVQSDFRRVFNEIRNDIECDKKILVIGVPCQIAAVRSSFKNTQLKNVFLVDLVCHGTPPQAYFSDYLKSICGDDTDNLFVAFRKKTYRLTIQSDDQIIYKRRYEIDPYYRSFMYGMIFRENCYCCNYSSSERVGDITVCDFWGLDRKSINLELPEFISCVLINTEKGKQLFGSIKSDCSIIERSLEEAVRGNSNLQHPSTRHKDRDIFLKKIQEGCSFIEAVNQTSIKKEIVKCRIQDVLKSPYRRLRYGRWGGVNDSEFTILIAGKDY